VASALVVAALLDRDPPGAHGDPSGATEEAAPQRESALKLVWRIKTSCFATFAYGYFQASVVLFLPLYLVESKGIAREQTVLIPAFFAAGMLLFSNVAGRLGDRIGHLRVMRGLALVGMTMVLGFVFLETSSTATRSTRRALPAPRASRPPVVTSSMTRRMTRWRTSPTSSTPRTAPSRRSTRTVRSSPTALTPTRPRSWT
jgi:nitrate/nitrite transporter NarK